MNEHDAYMADFMRVYEALERWGPGSEADTCRALSMLPTAPRSILDIGCGKGLATLVLAEHSQASITALDDQHSALDQLALRFEQQGLSDRLETVCASMTELPFPKARFDLIWAEGSAYIMGVEYALAAWRDYLSERGCLVISDMVWWADIPSEDADEFWGQEYPDMQQVSARLEQMEKAGYRIVDHFPLSDEAWWNYYTPLQKRVSDLAPDMAASAALVDIRREVDVCTRHADEFGYQMFVLEKR